MTRRREGQRGFGQVVLFGLLGPPETLLDPALRRIDGLLDDEALVDAVWRALPPPHPPNARGGRPAAPPQGRLPPVGAKPPQNPGYRRARGERSGTPPAPPLSPP